MWTELLFTVQGDQAESWSDALLEAGALSVQTEDADADSPDEQAIFGEPGEPAPSTSWSRTLLSALIAEGLNAQTLLDEAAQACGFPVPRSVSYRTIADQDWVRLTQSQFDPIEIGSRLLISPSWHLHAQQARATQRRVLQLDPGLAFGTGSHPTTRMCLEWLDRHLEEGSTVIDYGCGSGILAIAAARLGASRVSAIDIDPQALVSSRDNARANEVTIEVLPVDAPLPPAADVVLANILANPLRMLAPLLSDLVRPGGWLVLAGLLERQADELCALYDRIALEVVDCRDGWACLAGRTKNFSGEGR